MDRGRLSHHEWSGNSQADEMARSGATRYSVAPGDVRAHGTAWDKSADLAHYLSEAALYICSSGEWSADTKSADELEVRDVVPVARARLQVTFHEIAWALDRWRCSRCQRYERNKSTLAALKRTVCVPLFGAARGATPSLPRVHSSHDVQDRSRGAPCAGPAAQTAALRWVDVAQEHVPLTQGASVSVGWSLAATRFLELGCWMMQLSPCREFC